MSIGNNIKRKREELGYTQEELAQKMGYKSKSTINKIELGKNDVPQRKIMQFAKVLNTTVEYLMSWDEEKTKELVELFNNLDSTGKDKLIDYAKDMQKLHQLKDGNDIHTEK